MKRKLSLFWIIHFSSKPNERHEVIALTKGQAIEKACLIYRLKKRHVVTAFHVGKAREKHRSYLTRRLRELHSW
ncbi:MAG: hypothetical protein CMI53_04725 [Parcubacteria group bacterium]|jgi:hypothetical protein|nr:hypothetical protein [Parcubacteria group bacterium]